MNIREFQQLMADLYFHNDQKRGIHRTALWLMEEMGELSAELKHDQLNLNKDAIKEEMADIYAWVASLANLLEIDLNDAVSKKYPDKCLKCGENPCVCEKNLP